MVTVTARVCVVAFLSASSFFSFAGCDRPEDSLEQAEQTASRPLFGACGGPSPPAFVFEDINFPGASQTIPAVLNSAGVVSGWYIDAANHNHGFTWHAGTYTTVDVPGATDTYLLSTFGSVLEGSYRDGAGHVHGFLFSGGVWNSLDVPGSAFTQLYPFEVGSGLGTSALMMNAANVIVGEYATANGLGHGFILKDGVYTTVDHPQAFGNPGSGTILFSAATDGRTVGRVTRVLPRIFEGFLYQDGVFTPVIPPCTSGLFGTQANGINEHGDIAGVYSSLDTRVHGYLYTGGHYYTVDYPGKFNSELHSVTDDGDVVGSWGDLGNTLHGFIGRRVH